MLRNNSILQTYFPSISSHSSLFFVIFTVITFNFKTTKKFLLFEKYVLLNFVLCRSSSVSRSYVRDMVMYLLTIVITFVVLITTELNLLYKGILLISFYLLYFVITLLARYIYERRKVCIFVLSGWCVCLFVCLLFSYLFLNSLYKEILSNVEFCLFFLFDFI
jgi:hypothetical protein